MCPALTAVTELARASAATSTTTTSATRPSTTSTSKRCALVNRFAGHNKGFPNRFDVVTIRDDKMLTQPLRWREPKRIFVNSLSDLFHADVPDEFIARVFAVMAGAPQHTFQLLTKRHGRMRSLLRSERFQEVLAGAARQLYIDQGRRVNGARLANLVWPLPNVWLGVSVENQQWADLRVPALLGTPAAVRFLSCEPLLGPVCLDPWHTEHDDGRARCDGPLASGLDWVIAGGESGKGARPMHPDWARSLRDQCVAAGVPFLFKQWGNWAPHLLGHSPANVGKKAAGRELDGRTWDEYPVVSA